MKLALIFVLFAVPGSAQTVPLVADAALSGLDSYTTVACQRAGAAEIGSAWELGRHPGPVRVSLTLAAESAGVELAAWELRRRGHARVAKILQWGRVAVEAGSDIDNAVWLARRRR